MRIRSIVRFAWAEIGICSRIGRPAGLIANIQMRSPKTDSAGAPLRRPAAGVRLMCSSSGENKSEYIDRWPTWPGAVGRLKGPLIDATSDWLSDDEKGLCVVVSK